jgi:glutathione S-transferase
MEKTMKLFYAKGACSLAPHIIMAELNMVYELESVDTKTKTCASGDFKKINPKGSVPALKMENGEILTEGAVIDQYLADQKNDSTIFPKLGTIDRYRCMEWLNFIATDLHKSYTPFFMAGMMTPTTAKEVNTIYTNILTSKVDYVSTKLGTNEYLMGKNFTLADAYLFTVLSWSKHIGFDLSKWSNITAYQERVGTRPAVIKAMKEEGLL